MALHSGDCGQQLLEEAISIVVIMHPKLGICGPRKIFRQTEVSPGYNLV